MEWIYTDAPAIYGRRMGYSDETSASEARGLQRERRDLEVQRCAAAEDVCGRQVACVFALTTALALMGLDSTHDWGDKTAFET